MDGGGVGFSTIPRRAIGLPFMARQRTTCCGEEPMSDGRRGSVKQQANGTWSFVVDIHGDDGTRKQTRRRGFKSKREAQAELTRILGALENRAYVAPRL